FANGKLSANGGTWNYQANSVRFSSYGFGDNYRVSFTVDAPGAYNMIGLGSVESSANYADIDYAFYLVGSELYIYESGKSRINNDNVAVGDTLAIEVNSGTIRYLRNDTVVREVTYNGNTPDFYVDSSFYSGLIRLSGLMVTSLSGAGLTADADNDGVTNEMDLDSDNDTIPDVIEA
ncbi:MAG: hypothetical protein GY770_35215, partial [Aestuariibacter sp.]|nr:hypothetical protein [Aestuariibacter sp.]